MSDSVQSVDRAIDILFALSAGCRRLTEIAQFVGLSKATTHRLLKTVAREELVIHDPRDNTYALGPGILRLAQSAIRAGGSVVELSRPALIRLAGETGETATLHVRLGLERVCVEEIASASALRYSAPVGSRTSLHVGAAGKALLAFEEPEALEQTLAALTLVRLTSSTIVDEPQLRAELARVRADGWAWSVGERVPGAAALSLPVFDASGQILAVVSVLGPETRVTAARFDELFAAASRAVETIHGLIGAQPERSAKPADEAARGEREVA